jgi:hypothetical protein
MQQKCIYCDEEISIDEEAWSLGEPQNKCKLCREDPLRVIEHIRRRGGFKAVFGDEEDRPRRSP